MAEQKPNVILITIDSLRCDHLGCYGYSRDTSPNIDNLASRGVVFSEAISNGGQTPDAFPAILASKLPSGERVGTRAAEPPGATLAEQFKEAGYRTAAYNSNPFLSHFYGYDRGFDIFSDGLEELSLWKGRIWMRALVRRWRGLVVKTLTGLATKALSPILSRVEQPITTAQEITDQAMSWLKRRQGRFFLWIHYMDVHYPYLPLPQYLAQFRDRPVSRRRMADLCSKMLKEPEKLSPAEVTTLIDLYDADIRYVDDTVGLLLAGLGSDLANTVVVVTADHGEEFGEHGRFGHASLYDEVIHVPLVIAGPGIKSRTVVKKQVSLLDLAPTVCRLAGIDKPQGFQGVSLLPSLKGGGEVTKGTTSLLTKPDWGRRSVAYRTPGWKYIMTESLDGAEAVLSEEVYDLKSDPQEKRNLQGTGSTEAKAFEQEAIGELTRFKKQKREQKAAYEKERIKRLKDSGKI